MRTRTHRAAALAAALAAFGLPALAAPAPSRPVSRPVTDAMLRNPDPGEWLMWRRTFDAWGFSPLNQITPANVGRLQLVWSRGLPAGRQEGTPLVHDGVMYFPAPNDQIAAFDAKTGDLLWEHKRPIPEDMKDYVRNVDDNRSIAIWDNLIIDTSADGWIFALDAKTGKDVWQTMINDYKVHAGIQSSGPIVAGGKVISTRACDPTGGPQACVITAHDAKTGKELWRFFNIPRPGEPGFETWGNVPYEQRWHVGAWMTPSYDPELNLVYIGTSVTKPAPKFAITGNDNKYLYNNSTLALNADTGKLVWHYQHVVDNWDLDHPFERMLVDTVVAPDPKEVAWINPKLKPGERRKVLTGIPGKTGIVYTLDRATGEFLWARPTIMQNVVKSIDGATGEVTINPDALFHKLGDTRLICPTSAGGRNWQAGSYSPTTGLMFVPMQNTCSNTTAVVDKPGNAEASYGIRGRTELAPGMTTLGVVQAISASTGRTAWKYDSRPGVMALVSTAGGLVFVGDIAGRFHALDQRSGKPLWKVGLGSVVSGQPISYAVDGKQYVAISTGTSNPAAMLSLTPELTARVDNNLFVFALPD